MRYFQTSNASRRYLAGGFAFIFESVANIGGSWLGVLAVGDDSAASALAADVASGKIPQITEITAADYEAQKKTPQKSPPNFRAYPLPQSSEAPQLPLVGRAAAATPTASTKTVAAEPAPTVKTQLKSARIEVPDELRLETGDRGGKKK